MLPCFLFLSLALFIGTQDSLVPGPANAKRSVPSPAGQAGEPAVKHNASIPSLADQFLAAEAAVVAANEPTIPMMLMILMTLTTPTNLMTTTILTTQMTPTIPMIPMMLAILMTPVIPTIPMIPMIPTILMAQMTPTTQTMPTGPMEPSRDNAGQLVDAAKSLDPYRSDEDLGDLDWRFSADKGRFAMDEEVRCLNSRLVIMDPDNGAEHVLHGSRAELYLADNLRNLKHSFENADEVPNVQTNPVRSIHYPQGCNDFTEELSVVHSMGLLFHQFFKDLKLSVPSMIKFVIWCGMRDLEQDGELMQNEDYYQSDHRPPNDSSLSWCSYLRKELRLQRQQDCYRCLIDPT
jgi:hypothetical protein